MATVDLCLEILINLGAWIYYKLNITYFQIGKFLQMEMPAIINAGLAKFLFKLVFSSEHEFLILKKKKKNPSVKAFS